MDWISRQRFRAMLLFLVAMLVIAPVLEEHSVGRYSFDGFRTLIFLTAFVILVKEKRHRLLGIGFGIPALIGGWIVASIDRADLPALETGFHALAAIFLAFTIGAILRAVYRDGDVTTDSVCGAFCGYLLVGVIFGHLYCIVESLVPDSFAMSAAASSAQSVARDRYLLFYFSMITMTTVGYGDILPSTALTRGLAMIEAVAGQFYIAVLVAELIGKRVSQPPAERR
jgi:hypothetical protein